MFKSIIVVMSQDSVPYCYYSAPDQIIDERKMVPLESVKKTVEFAKKNGISLNVVFGKERLPDSLADVLKNSSYIGIYPLSHQNIGESDITVLTEDDLLSLSGAKGNIIIRIEWRSVGRIPELVRSLHSKIKKCNIHIIPPEKMTDTDVKTYHDCMMEVSGILVQKIIAKTVVEVNIITDRVLLGEMQNCSAGVDHVTLAPNGKFYVCPGFYYRDEKDSIGNDIESIKIPNGHLFTLEKSPICSNCDAYHCKRCVYLNKTRTLEVNTPSREQCVISHLEREATRNFIEQAGKVGLSWNVSPIPPLDYLDPLEIIKNHKTPPFKMKNHGTGAPPVAEDRRLLFQILEQQKDILRRLERLEKERK